MGKVTMIQHRTSFNYCTVYGKHTIQDRKSLWEELRMTVHGINNPYLIMGDFNTILTSEDRINGNHVQEIEIRDFKNFLIDAGLDELKTVGRKYTWSNNHVHSRIDRILANAEWIQQWPHMEGIIMNSGFSDHCPLSVGFDITNQAGMRPFKFLNCLASLSEFDATVKQIWRSNKRGPAML
ncbi:uncharacterized protein LOC142169104 [Nicotiana tabacum]|uniref:Uncharacterized protein LOC142169104 n=1 Tax=Nicotiana tabacum TaxID=4097 RepID=A0AC58SN69_TOBAC